MNYTVGHSDTFSFLCYYKAISNKLVGDHPFCFKEVGRAGGGFFFFFYFFLFFELV